MVKDCPEIYWLRLQQNNSTKFMIIEKNIIVFVVHSTCQIEVLRVLM
jgi:hypothetical protein